MESTSFQSIEIFYNGGASDCWQIDAIDPNDPGKQMVRTTSTSGRASAEVDLGPGVPVELRVLNNSGRSAAFRLVAEADEATVKTSRRVEDMDITSFMYLCHEQGAGLVEREAVSLSSSHGEPPISITFSGRGS